MPVFRINDAEMRIQLRNFVDSIRPDPILKIFAEIMRESRERTFREQGSPAGSWPPLAASTLRRRGARRLRANSKGRGLQQLLSGASRNTRAGRQILIRTGRLKNSVTSVVVEGTRLLIGTNLVYAAIHQRGGFAGRGHKTRIPARPYLVFRPEDPERMRTAAQRFIDQQIEANDLG